MRDFEEAAGAPRHRGRTTVSNEDVRCWGHAAEDGWMSVTRIDPGRVKVEVDGDEVTMSVSFQVGVAVFGTRRASSTSLLFMGDVGLAGDMGRSMAAEFRSWLRENAFSPGSPRRVRDHG